MASDKRLRSRTARTTISTDPNTDDSFDEVCSAPPLSRKDHSEEHQSGSKFAEAMNNPDWRRRRDECNVSESAATTTSNTNHLSLRSHESFQTTEEKMTPFSDTRNSSICTRDCIDSVNHSRLRPSKSEIDLKDTNGTPANKGHANLGHGNVQAAENKSISGKTSVQWTVLLDTNLAYAPYKDRQLRIIQVTPLPTEYSNSNEHGRSIMGVDRDFPIAHIQRIVGRSSRTKQEIENPPEDSCPTPSDRSSNPPRKEMNTITSNSEEKRIERAREAVFKDPAVANISSGYVSSQFRTMKDPALPVDQARKDKELQRRNAAFIKILQKLRQGSKKESNNTKENSLQRDSLRHGYPWGSNSSQQSHSATQQRKFDGSDSTTGSLYDPRKGNEASHDSGICIDAESLTRGLNPRAREFLSFKRSFTELPQSRDPANLSDEAFLKRMNLDRSSVEDEDAIENSRGTGSVNLIPSIPTIESDCGVKKTESVSNSGVTAIPSIKHDLGAFNYPLGMLPSSGFGFPFGACQPSMQSILTPGLQPGLGLSGAIGNLPTPATFGSQLNQPIVNPALQQYSIASGPFMGNATAFQMPFNSMTGGGYYSSRPSPVSKPTDPDTTQQQKYEEYIEWRKANEPGYALACKSRQQRRAQRGTPQQTVT